MAVVRFLCVGFFSLAFAGAAQHIKGVRTLVQHQPSTTQATAVLSSQPPGPQHRATAPRH